MYLCDNLKYAIKTGDIIHDIEGNKFYVYGAPMPDGTTKCIQMVHCLYCGRPLVHQSKPPIKGEITTEHVCSKCEHKFQVNILSETVLCPECGNWDIES